MAKIYGNIGSFAELIKKMDGAYLPAILTDITAFKKNFPKAPFQIKEKVRKEILDEINNFKEELKKSSVDYDIKLKEREEVLIKEKGDIEQKINIYSVKPNNIFIRLYYSFKLKRLLKRKERLNNYLEEEKRKPFISLEKEILSAKENISNKETNIEKLVEEKVEPEIGRLNTINTLLLKNNKLYEGAIGEQRVLDELKKLPDSFSIINNLQRYFRKGIYRKKTNDWIYSVQIDHILIGPYGIFLIETKNWSQDSINNETLFSPVEQVNRARHALYCYLNDAIKNGYLSSFEHHWGPKQISPKSIIVTICHTPQQEFQYVKILSLKNLLWYITSRESVFSENQVNELTRFLSRDKTESNIAYRAEPDW